MAFRFPSFVLSYCYGLKNFQAQYYCTFPFPFTRLFFSRVKKVISISLRTNFHILESIQEHCTPYNLPSIAPDIQLYRINPLA